MKKVLSVTLVLLLVLCCFAGCSGNSDDTATTTQAPATEPPRQVATTEFHPASEAFAGGSGTESDPFEISDAGHLVLLHEMLQKEYADVNLGTTYTNGFYILTADIALNDTADFENWGTTAPAYGWTPIGTNGNDFAGVLDGNGHKITGMFIDADGSENEAPIDNYGLFEDLWGAVKNLTVEQSYLCTAGATTNTGIIAGSAYTGTVENCTADAVIELHGGQDAGGITGNGGTISDCTFSGTVTQLDDGFAHIGGIAGCADKIENCVFSGTLKGNAHTGGIVGYGGNVKNCTNKGTVIGENAGGISGRVYAAGTNQEIENPQTTIEGCTNEGSVTGTSATHGIATAGGIIGWMGNDEADIPMSVINCTNKGTVDGNNCIGGVVGKLSVERSNLIKIENCTNEAAINGDIDSIVGGIVGQITGAILHQEGDVLISDCKNRGSIISEGQYSAGIVSYLLLMGETTDFNLTIESCANEADLQASAYAGGILAFSNIGFNSEVSANGMKLSPDTGFKVNNCANSGNITVTSSNAMAGGIIGVYGLAEIFSYVTDCSNTGDVTVDFTLSDAEIAEMQGSEWPEFYQIAGGIVGRIGDALKLSTAEDNRQSDSYINASNAYLQIENCNSTGAITAPDYSFILNKWEQPLYVNYLGGVVGQAAATFDYKFNTENCSYSGADRGFGDTAHEDFGTKN